MTLKRKQITISFETNKKSKQENTNTKKRTFPFDKNAVYNGEKRFKYLYYLELYKYYWDTKPDNPSGSQKIQVKMPPSYVAKRRRNRIQFWKNFYKAHPNIKPSRKFYLRNMRKRRRRMTRRRYRKKIKVISKKVVQGINNGDTWIYKKRKRLAATKQVRKLFNAGQTIKRENIVNEGQAIVKDIGLNKYRYFSSFNLTVKDIYQFLRDMPTQALLSATYTETTTPSSSHIALITRENAEKGQWSDVNPTSNLYTSSLTSIQQQMRSIYSNRLDQAMGYYIGKCTYQYTITNPTNYTLYVDLYDLVARQDYVNPNSTDPGRKIQDTEFVTFTDPTGQTRNGSINYQGVPSPEACIYYGCTYLDNVYSNYTITGGIPNNPDTTTGDGTYRVKISQPFYDAIDNDGSTVAKWNSIGISPTSIRYFNKLWKVKKTTRIALAPNGIYKHNQVIKLGQIMDRASFFYRFPDSAANPYLTSNLGIIGGITSCLLVRAHGQLATQMNTVESNTIQEGNYQLDNNIFHFPIKLLIKKTKNENIYYGRSNLPVYKTVTDKLTGEASLQQVTIFTNLDEIKVATTDDSIMQQDPQRASTSDTTISTHVPAGNT